MTTTLGTAMMYANRALTVHNYNTPFKMLFMTNCHYVKLCALLIE